jgi:chromosome partitioning protein
MAKVEKLTLDQLEQVAANAEHVLRQIHEIMSDPHPTKKAPVFNSPYIADLIGVDRTSIPYLTTKNDLPAGRKVTGTKAREYSLEETIQWSQKLGKHPRRPEGKKARSVAVVNYKGGVAKTTTSVALCQALTLRGQKVLLVDCDPQGTATQLSGFNPEQSVEIEDTIMPYIYREQPDLRYAVRDTYWHNLSIIPASSVILAAEFALPGLAMETKRFPFWDVLNQGVEPLREDFDVVVFDTAPSLSHLTVNAMLASDGLLMPCPPDALDFASSVQFWSIFAELSESLPGVREKKQYDFMTVVYTKVQNNDASRLVKTFMEKAYLSHINGIEIPESNAAKMSSAQLKTIYDMAKPFGSAETYRRYKEPMDRLADYVLDKIAIAWED